MKLYMNSSQIRQVGPSSFDRPGNLLAKNGMAQRNLFLSFVNDRKCELVTQGNCRFRFRKFESVYHGSRVVTIVAQHPRKTTCGYASFDVVNETVPAIYSYPTMRRADGKLALTLIRPTHSVMDSKMQVIVDTDVRMGYKGVGTTLMALSLFYSFFQGFPFFEVLIDITAIKNDHRPGFYDKIGFKRGAMINDLLGGNNGFLEHSDEARIFYLNNFFRSRLSFVIPEIKVVEID